MKRVGHLRRSNSQPFWLPALTYYFLSAAVAIAVFVLVWAMLVETRDDAPWVTAGLFSSASMVSAVVIREIILRSRRQRVYEVQRKLDNVLLAVPASGRRVSDPSKLTLERNALLVEDLIRKSEAAFVLARLADSHKEVFLLCESYLKLAVKELPTIGAGSPRRAAITRGRDKAERLHRKHMLKWVEIEVKEHTQAAASDERIAQKLEKTERALEAVNTVLSYYPNELKISESKQVIEQYIFSLNLTAAMHRAERAENKGNIPKALEYFKKAERIAEGNPSHIEGVDAIRDKLREEIERLEGAGFTQ